MSPTAANYTHVLLAAAPWWWFYRCSWQVYWVGPILGAVLAAGLYEYLYSPDPEVRKRLKLVFHKDSAGRYKEVEAEEAAVKAGSTRTVSRLEKEEKQEAFQDTAGEVLSSA